jgi:hypothetical protein
VGSTPVECCDRLGDRNRWCDDRIRDCSGDDAGRGLRRGLSCAGPGQHPRRRQPRRHPDQPPLLNSATAAGGREGAPGRVITTIALAVGVVGGIYGIGGGSILAPILVALGYSAIEVAPAALSAVSPAPGFSVGCPRTRSGTSWARCRCCSAFATRYWASVSGSPAERSAGNIDPRGANRGRQRSPLSRTSLTCV